MPEQDFRKVVTVLFCDLVGSTSLGESADPEAVRAQMRGYFADVRRAIERHGGTVEKFIGDAVMAVFGAPVSHEDDALRAVRAAWEIRDVVTAHDLEARIGVNTGEVVMGSGADETLVVGDAVNVGARLEQAASAGEVLVGDRTRALVRDAVLVESVGELVLKGKSDPVTAFRVVDVDPDADAVARRLDAPLVGRDRERRRLWRDFEDAVADRTCRLFTLLGPAGIGKSRLVADFLARLDTSTDVLRGRCLPYGEGITYWPLLEILHAANVSTDAVLLSSPEETRVAFRRLLEARAADRPQVVVIDDVQWAEPTFLDVIEHVADLARNTPIFLLCVARTDLLDRRADWGGGKVNATSLLLEPLDGAECDRLIEQLLGGDGVAAETRERIAAQSQGNPLFVEELVAITEERGESAEAHAAPTIHALLQARLDALPVDERTVVGRAAIEGEVFHRGAIAALVPNDLVGNLDSHLAALVRKEVFRPETPLVDGEAAFRFRHLLLRDAAYDALPKALRAELHAMFADWLERASATALELDELVGYHLERSVRLREELGARRDTQADAARAAASRLLVAGRAAAGRADYAAAIALLGRGTDLLSRGDPTRVAALTELGRTLMRRGEFSDAESTLERAADEARASGARSSELRARLLLGDLRSRISPTMRTEEGLADALAAAAELEHTDDLATLALAYDAVGMCRFVLGRAAEGIADLERAAAMARAAGDPTQERRVLNTLLRPMTWGPTPARNLRAYCDQLLARSDTNVADRVHALQVRAVALAMSGDETAMRATIDRGEALIDEYDLKLQRGIFSVDVGWALQLTGDVVGAERMLARGDTVVAEAGATGVRSTLLGLYAAVLARVGRLDEAERAAATARAIASDDDFDAQVRWRTGLARARLRRGDLEQAERVSREAADLIRRTDFIVLEAETQALLGEVLTSVGNAGGATLAFERALALHARKENVVGARETASLLEAPAPPSS